MDKNKKLFPQRLWELIHDDKYSFCLRWSQDGQRVYLNRNEFETHYLKTASNQFHTQKAISFVRQMNMYGFRKVDDCFYENDNFKRNCPHLLKNMIRKHSNRSYFSSPPSSVGPSQLHAHQHLHPHHPHHHPHHHQAPYPTSLAHQHQHQHQHLSPPRHQLHAAAGPYNLSPGATSPSGARSLGDRSPVAGDQVMGQYRGRQQLAGKQPTEAATQEQQAELRRLHEHLQESGGLASSLRRRDSLPADDQATCRALQAAQVARSISNLEAAAMASHTELASSLYYRLAALNFSHQQQQHQQQQQQAASGRQGPSALQEAEQQQQLIGELLRTRQVSPPTTTTTTNNPNSLLARPTITCLHPSAELSQRLAALQQQQQQQQRQPQQQQQQSPRQLSQVQQQQQQQANFLDSSSGSSGALSAAEQLALQENLVRTFLQLNSGRQQHSLAVALNNSSSGSNNNNHNHINQLPDKSFLLRRLQEQSLLSLATTLSSGEPPPPPAQPPPPAPPPAVLQVPPQANLPLELVVKKR